MFNQFPYWSRDILLVLFLELEFLVADLVLYLLSMLVIEGKSAC